MKKQFISLFFLFLLLGLLSYRFFEMPKEVKAVVGTLNLNAPTGTQTFSSPNMANLYVTGSVGIGTTAPASKLTINGTAGTNAFLHITTPTAGSTISDGILFGLSGDAEAYLVNRESGAFRFGTNNTEVMRISGTSVGIGTTAPTNGTLEIQAGTATAGYFASTSDAQISLNSTNTWAGITFDDSGSPDYIFYNGQYSTFAIGGGGSNVSGKKLHIDGGTSIGANYDASAAVTNGLAVEGNVGIGTTAPGNKLDVAGNVTLDNYVIGAYGTIARSTDEWLRLNQDSGGTADHTNGIYTPGLFRADGGIQVNALTVIDAAGQYHYGTTNAVAGKFGQVNTSGFGVDATNNADWDLLVYETANYIPAIELGYNGTANISTYDTNESLTINANGTGNINLMTSGTGNAGIGTASPAQKLDVNGHTIFGVTGYTYMYLRDDESTTGPKSIHANSNLIGFLKGDGNWAVNWDSSGNQSNVGSIAANGGVTVDGSTVIDNGAGWHRTWGDTGWFNDTYDVGIYATDTTWIRAYPASKYFRAQYVYQDGPGGYAASINGTLAANYVPKADGSYRVTNSQIYDNGTGVAIGTATVVGSNRLTVVGAPQQQLNLWDSTNGGTTNVSRKGNAGGGLIEFYSNANPAGVYAGASLATGAYYNSSDVRIKKDIVTLPSVLEKIMRLRPIAYHGLSQESKDPLNIGFVAQEVEPIFPETVGTDKNTGYKSLTYQYLFTYGIKAIQEQQVQLSSIQSTMTDFITQFKAGLIETKKLIVDGVDILKKLDELSAKVESQQKQIEELKATVEKLKK